MGFFRSRVTCFCRFKVSKAAPRLRSGISKKARGHHRPAADRDADGTQVGWIAGDHPRYPPRLEKNVIAETLQFAMRVDEVKIPSDLLRAYYAVELEALA